MMITTTTAMINVFRLVPIRLFFIQACLNLLSPPSINFTSVELVIQNCVLNACSFSMSMYLCVCGFTEQLAEHKGLVGGPFENGSERQ